jgi:predicted kinase
MNELDDMPERSLAIPRRSLVILIGPSGSGKSTFAGKHFSRFQVVESDHCRALVCDDEADQSATPAAFDLLHYLTVKRLEFGKLTVIDATNVEAKARKGLLTLARDYNFTAVAIMFDIGEEATIQQNAKRPNRQVAPEVIRRQHQDLRLSKKDLSREGFSRVYVLKSPEEAAGAKVAVE